MDQDPRPRKRGQVLHPRKGLLDPGPRKGDRVPGTLGRQGPGPREYGGPWILKQFYGLEVYI